jgi:teichuronic acid biosynthesis glycosyltransferase TuaC
MFRVVERVGSGLAPPPPSPERGGRLRVLVVTKVFPNPREPHMAAFNRQQLGALARMADVDVWAVLPWFPGAGLLNGRTRAGLLQDVPTFAWTDGLFVRHPRVLHLPRVDYSFAPALYVASLWPAVRKLRGRVDLVLGSFAYPDGIAAVALGRLLGVPSVVGVLGSDLNQMPSIPGVTTMLRLAFARASRVVAVSRALAAKAITFGAPADRVAVVPNGVDPAIFYPQDRAAARAALGLDPAGKWIVFVGRLETAKGVDDLLAAFEEVAAGSPAARLALVGDGARRARCEEVAAASGGKILVAGARPLSEVAQWLAACDLLTLPSWAEGTPNVVLEALASGRRVVATAVGGIPDVVNAPDLGELVPPRNTPALAGALRRALDQPYEPGVIAGRATVTWDESAARLLAELETAAAASHRHSPAAVV